MQYEIRAMRLAEILDTGFRLLRDHFGLLFGIGLVVYLPLGLAAAVIGAEVEAMTGAASTSPDAAFDMALVAASGVAIVLAYVVGFPLMSCAITHAVGSLYLGRDVSFGASFGVAWSRFLPLAGTYLLYGLLMLGFLALCGGLGFGLSLVLGDGAIVAAAFLAVFAGMYLTLAFLLLVQVIVLEGTAGMPALGRSRELMSGHMLRGLGLLVVLALLAGALGVGVSLALVAIPLIEPVGSAAMQAAIFAYTSAVTVVFYFDLRSRKEAFDLEHLARLVEEGDAAPRGPVG